MIHPNEKPCLVQGKIRFPALVLGLVVLFSPVSADTKSFQTELDFKLKSLVQKYDLNTFMFIRNSLIEFDNMKKNYENFHLQFLIKFSKFLGFEVSNISNFSNTHLQKKEVIVSSRLSY